MIAAQALLSIFAWTTAVALMTIIVVIGVIGILITGDFTRVQRRWRLTTLMGWIPYCTLSRVTVTYDDDYDPARPSVYCQPHVSMMDGHIATHALPTLMCGVMKAGHFKIPIYGWIMRMANGIGVPDENIAAQFRDRKERRISILVFPEGTRTLTGNVGPFRTGAFYKARDAEMPVVPVSIRGLYDVHHKGTWMVWPGHIEVHVGAQLETEGLDDAGVVALSQRVQQQLANFTARSDR